jgi:1,4-alpha-glucan branching enzyme
MAAQGKEQKKTATSGRREKIGRLSTSAPATSVTFRFDAPGATDVAIAGSFNNWTLRALKRRKDGIWSVTLRLAPGSYEYKFLIDDRWVEDPENPRKAPDPHGGYNSVCVVTDSAGLQAGQ